MNSRFRDFESLITRPDGSVDDLFSERQREQNQLEQIMSMTPQQGYQLSQDIKNQQDSLDAGLKVMMNQFSESIQQVLKDKPDATKQTKYTNVLPYGLKSQKAGENPHRAGLTQDVNEGLENLDHSLTKQTHSTYTKIYHRMFKDTYNELKEEMTENYGNSTVKDIDQECLNHIFNSAVGSMFDWTSIDPKSVGMGSIDHISELFQKYYYGEVNDKGLHPWEEIRSDYRKYGARQELEIQGDKFYNDFINGFFFRSCAKGYVSKETRAPKDFKSKVEGFYDFDPDLWFDNKDASGKKFKKDNDSDSYGNFFKVKQPVLLANARLAAAVPGNPTDVRNYTGPNSLDVAITALEDVASATRLKNQFTGTYNIGAGADAAAGSVFLVDHKKELCCLFHSGTFRKQQYLKAVNPVNRLLVATATLRNEPFNFTQMDKLNFGNGADYGNAGNNVKAGLATYNEEIEPLAQLLYNTCSIGFHLTHRTAAPPRLDTCLTAGGIEGLQVITGNGNNITEGGNAVGGIDIIPAAGGAAVGATRQTPFLSDANMDSARCNATFTKNSFQFIEIKTLLKGGNKKSHINRKTGLVKRLKPKHSRFQIKKISKVKLPTKDKKHNPVKKVIKQKGGAGDLVFDIRPNQPNGRDAPSLDASRRSLTITKKIFENYRKAIKKYVKIFGKGSTPNKIQTAILEKLAGITHFGVFYHGPDDTLNFGTDAAIHSIKFEELGEMFLFSSVITNTIKLMIHFFNNIKACINNFINLDLQDIKASINKQLKTVNTTNISSLNASYFEKYNDGCDELIKNIDKLVEFLQNNTMCLGKPKAFGNPAQSLIENEQLVMNLFFGANVNHQITAKAAAVPPLTNAVYPIEFYKFHHDLIDFFSINGNQDFKQLNSIKLQRSLRILTSNDVVLNNGYYPRSVNGTDYPQDEYSVTNVSFGGIPMTFHDQKSTHYSWITYRLLLLWREKSNEKLSDEIISEINQSLSQISSQDKIDIKKNVIQTYKEVRPVLADPKIDLGSKNKVLQNIFFSFFENSNMISKKIIDEHIAIEKKSKRSNVRGKTSISDIVQRRHLGPLESGRILIPDEIKIQQEMRKFSYKVDCLINLLHVILISKTTPTRKNFIIFMYSISRLRNFVYRLYYLNKTYYIENEQTKKKLLEDSGFSLSKDSKQQNTKKTLEIFNKLNSLQLKDQNSSSEDWWVSMEKSFRDRTTEIHGKYYRLYTYVLMDGEIYLIDIFSMAKSTYSVKSYNEILKKDVVIYRDHSGDEIYSPQENMLIKPITDLRRDTTYRKLLNGELHYEYSKIGSRDKKKKILEPLFIQGSTSNQLHDIVKDNYYVPAARGSPDVFVYSRNPETSFQLYKIQKHYVLHASAFRSWAYNLLFSMPTRVDVDDSFFKLHIQTPINTIPAFAKSQLEPSLKYISHINQDSPTIEFKSKVKVNNNSNLMLGNNIKNKRIESFTKYISREQLILLGLVFGDTLN